VKPDNELLFIISDVTSLDARPEIIQPSQSATFSASLKTCMISTLESCYI